MGNPDGVRVVGLTQRLPDFGPEPFVMLFRFLPLFHGITHQLAHELGRGPILRHGNLGESAFQLFIDAEGKRGLRHAKPMLCYG